MGMAHCFTCHHTFNTVSGFDKHRNYKTGGCEWPPVVGLHTDERGVWRQPPREETE